MRCYDPDNLPDDADELRAADRRSPSHLPPPIRRPGLRLPKPKPKTGKTTMPSLSIDPHRRDGPA